jgi:dolichyl-phosphate beta-glucosyltransferase
MIDGQAKGQPWYRQLFAYGFAVFAKTLLIRGFGDSQCGFKCFTREAVSRVFPPITCRSGLFDMEVLLLAARGNLRVAEVPVAWRHDADSRMTYNVWSALGLLRELFRIRAVWKVRWAVDLRAVECHEPVGVATRGHIDCF